MAKENDINVIQASIEQKSTTEAAKKLMHDAGSGDPQVALAAQAEIAVAITETVNNRIGLPVNEGFAEAVSTPIREGVLDGDLVSPIFVKEDFTLTGDMRIPLDLLSPGTEKDHVAYVMPDHGLIPQRRVEADYIMLNTYPIANSIDCTRRFFRNARFDVLRRMIEVLEAGFIKKDNDDGWQTLISAGNGRAIIVYDADATAGQFTPKLTSLMKTVMRRNGGGNSTSMDRRKLTDIYMSPEAFEDMTSWGLNLTSDDIRTQIHRSADGSLNGLFGVNFRDIDELGVGQEYQLYYTSTLSGSLGPSSDEELVVGVDLTQRDKAFINPIAESLQVVEDNTLHRQGLVGFYGTKEGGWAVLDVRYVLLGSF